MSVEIRSAFLHDALGFRNADRIADQAPVARSGSSKDNAWFALKEFKLSPKTRARHGIVAENKSDPACEAFDHSGSMRRLPTR